MATELVTPVAEKTLLTVPRIAVLAALMNVVLLVNINARILTQVFMVALVAALAVITIVTLA